MFYKMKSVFLLRFTLYIFLSQCFARNLTEIEKRSCMVVSYDIIRGYLNWSQEWFRKAAATKCQTSCMFTENKKELSKADVIVFHAPKHSMNTGLRAKYPNALFVMITMEQPKYAPILGKLSYLEKYMDLMITYSMAPQYPGTTVPNMPITYFPLNIVSPQAVLQPPRPFSQKTGYGSGVQVVLFASNCERAGATERSKYISELMKYIKVHSYGQCFHNIDEPEMPEDPNWPPVAQRRARKVKVLSNYKFYLAFENAPVPDYVSEKVFEGLIAGSLPIYRGTSGINRFVPSNNSVIDANNLTPRELAEKIKKLSTDEQAYNKYFEFKQKPLSEHFKQITLKAFSHPNILCRICDYTMNRQNS